MGIRGMRRPGLGLGFELGVNFNAGTGKDSGGGSASFNTSFSDISSGLFGESSTSTGSSTSSGREDTKVIQTEGLKIDQGGLMFLIDKALRGVGGLAEIFGEEAGAGVFSSSAAKQGSEDLISKIAGELALLTGTKTATNEGFKGTSSQSTSTQTSESDGLFDKIGL